VAHAKVSETFRGAVITGLSSRSELEIPPIRAQEWGRRWFLRDKENRRGGKENQPSRLSFSGGYAEPCVESAILLSVRAMWRPEEAQWSPRTISYVKEAWGEEGCKTFFSRKKGVAVEGLCVFCRRGHQPDQITVDKRILGGEGGAGHGSGENEEKKNLAFKTS